MKFCGECKNPDCPEEMPDPNSMACKHFKGDKITNGDVLRQMNDEELADRLGIHAMCDSGPAESSDCGVQMKTEKEKKKNCEISGSFGCFGCLFCTAFIIAGTAAGIICIKWAWQFLCYAWNY